MPGAVEGLGLFRSGPSSPSGQVAMLANFVVQSGCSSPATGVFPGNVVGNGRCVRPSSGSVAILKEKPRGPLGGKSRSLTAQILQVLSHSPFMAGLATTRGSVSLSAQPQGPLPAPAGNTPSSN